MITVVYTFLLITVHKFTLFISIVKYRNVLEFFYKSNYHYE